MSAARRGRARGQRSLFERVVFTFMGPADRGDLSAPVKEFPDRPVERCPKCGNAYADHEVVRDPGLTYMRCVTP